MFLEDLMRSVFKEAIMLDKVNICIILRNANGRKRNLLSSSYSLD